MTATVATVPAGLTFDPAADPARGRHLVLAMPWGAQIVPEHRHSGGSVLERGDVLVDRALARASKVNLNHDPSQELGVIVDAAEDEVGVWCVVDLNDAGERVLVEGNGDVSAELIMPNLRWYLSGLALLNRDEEPAIPGARVVFSRGEHQVYAVAPTIDAGLFGGQTLADIARRPDVLNGQPVVLKPWRDDSVPRGGQRVRVVTDVSAHKAFMASFSLAAAEAQIERDRAREADRLAERAAWEADRPEMLLNAACVPANLRPADSPIRQAYEHWERQQMIDMRERAVWTAELDQLRAELAEVTADRDTARAELARYVDRWWRRFARWIGGRP